MSAVEGEKKGREQKKEDWIYNLFGGKSLVLIFFCLVENFVGKTVCFDYKFFG